VRGMHPSRRGQRIWAALLPAGAVLLLATAGCSASVSPTAATSPRPSTSPSPTLSRLPHGTLFLRGSILSGMTETSASDAWAVGSIPTARDGSTADSRSAALIVHWNGTTWSQVAVPEAGSVEALTGVAATSATDAWAVGSYYNTRTLILHWAGSSWQEVASPTGGVLTGVAVGPSGVAWAVGQTINGWPLILRLVGGKWQNVTAPDLPSTVLESVVATSPSNAWAVGVSDTKPLILHWNGTAWSKAPVPSPAGGGTLEDVTAAQDGTAWAVGTSFAAPGRTFILRWNGTVWTQVPSPTPASGAALEGVTASGTKGAWAVGTELANPGRTFVLRWNGTSWTQVPSPDPGTKSDTLTRVVAIPGGPTWAIGYESGVGPIILRWTGSRWSATQ